MRRTPLLLAFVLSLPVAARADEPPDPAALLREAQSAETVDRDPAKALALYRRVVDVGGKSDAVRDALLKVAELLEAKGENEEALKVLERVSAEFGDRLDAATKQRVTDTMVKLTPQGRTVLTPLGHMGGGASGVASSPFEDKVEVLLHQIVNTPTNYDAISAMIVPLGRDTVPVLERALFDDIPSMGKYAARLLAEIGSTDAAVALERGVRRGDAFTRAAALEGLDNFAAERGSAAERALLAVIDRLLDGKVAEDQRSLLLGEKADRLPAEALMRLHLAGGPDAAYWLQSALYADATGALNRAAELSQGSGPEAEHAWRLVVEKLRNPSYISAVDSKPLVALFTRVVREGFPNDNLFLEAVAKRMHNESDLRAQAWRTALAIPSAQRRLQVVRSLAAYGGLPSLVFDEPENGAAVLRSLLSVGEDYFGWLLRLVEQDGPFWDVLLRLIPDLTPAEQIRLLEIVRKATEHHRSTFVTPPTRLDAAWLPLLRTLPADTDPNSARWMANAAARSGSSGYLQVVRERALRGSGGIGEALLWGLALYRGPGVVPVLLEVILDPDVAPSSATSLTGLLGREGPEGIRALFDLARRRGTRSADAVVQLMALGRVKEVEALIDEELRAAERGPPGHRASLVNAAARLHLRSAFPFLLREFREGNDRAAAVMNDIQAFHTQIATFESWVAGEDARKDLPALLASPDPEIRRAAVLSLAALDDRASLPTLVRFASEEKDPRVRQAALQAVERLATKTEAPKPAEAGGGGR